MFAMRQNPPPDSMSEDTLRLRLGESERRLASIINAVPGIIYVAAADSDNYHAVFVSPQIESELGFTSEEWLCNPKLWAEQVHEDDRERVFAIVDELAPKQDIFEYEYRIWTKDRQSLRWYRDRVQVERHPDGSPEEFIGIMVDITERKERETELVRYKRQIDRAKAQIIEALARMAHARDPYTAGHQNRVSLLSVAIASKLGLDERCIEGLALGAHIHDIGKIYIPSEILNRPGRLSEPEFQLIKTHPAVGLEMVREINFPWPIHDMIFQHHERLDGSGYPNGLTGEAICIEARIIAVADTVEAMSSHRPYRPALGIEPALALIEKNSGRHYDPDVVRACVALFRKDGFAERPGWKHESM